MTKAENLPHYDELIREEARFWGNRESRPDNPQVWDDPDLARIFHEPNRRRTIQRAAAVGGAVLELGCGNGDMAIELASRGMRVEAIDLSEQRIARARERANEVFEGSPFSPPDFHARDLNRPDFAPDRYDCVVAFDALHHILAIEELVKNVYRALRPGGWLVVHDYVGMGRVRKMFAALFYAVLPTYKSYAEKLALARRLPRFLAGERGKRDRLRNRTPEQTEESPFEEVSLTSIEKEIGKRFRIVERSYHDPFFFYLAPKIRMPRRMRGTFGKALHAMDTFLIRTGICKGAYVFIVARKEG